MPAHAMVARPILELDADPDERLAGPQLVRRRDVGRDRRRSPGRTRRLHSDGPVVSSPDDEAAEERPRRAPLDHHGQRLLDDRVVGRRPVVVAVPELPAIDQAPDAGQRGAGTAEVHGAVLGRGHRHEAVREGAVRRDDSWFGGGRDATRRAGLDRRPAEWRHLDLDQDLPPVRGEHDQLPESLGRGRRCGADLVDQFVDIELGRLADIVDQEGDRRDLGVGVDACVVQLATEQLAAVAAASEQLREPVAAQSEAGDHRIPARDLLGRHGRPAHRERELPAGRHGCIEGDRVRPGRGRRVDHRPAAERHAGRDVPSGVVEDAAPELFRLGVAAEDLGDHHVVRAPADRVVGGVVDDPPPGELEQALRPGAAVQRRERFGVALEESLDAPGRDPQVDPRGGDAHQHVRPRAGAQLSGPVREGPAIDLGPGGVVGQCLEPRPRPRCRSH